MIQTDLQQLCKIPSNSELKW